MMCSSDMATPDAVPGPVKGLLSIKVLASSRVAALMTIAMFWFPANAAQAHISPTQAEAATVVIYVVDPFGHALPYRIGRFTDHQTRRDYSSRFAEGRAHGIPFGEYFYQAVRNDFTAPSAQLSGNISIKQPRFWLTLVQPRTIAFFRGEEVDLGLSRPPGYVIRGRVAPAPTGTDPIWIRMQSLYGDTSLESDVDSNGEFRIEEYLRGNFLLVVYRAGRVLAVRPVSILGSAKPEPIIVNLPAEPPDFLPVR